MCRGVHAAPGGAPHLREGWPWLRALRPPGARPRLREEVAAGPPPSQLCVMSLKFSFSFIPHKHIRCRNAHPFFGRKRTSRDGNRLASAQRSRSLADGVGTQCQSRREQAGDRRHRRYGAHLLAPCSGVGMRSSEPLGRCSSERVRRAQSTGGQSGGHRRGPQGCGLGALRHNRNVLKHRLFDMLVFARQSQLSRGDCLQRKPGSLSQAP